MVTAKGGKGQRTRYGLSVWRLLSLRDQGLRILP
jgi:hypothetical protein